MAESSWQETLRVRLAERNTRESAFAPIIEQYRRLAQQAKVLKERNATLLRAVGSVKGGVGSSTNGGDDNPVRAAYLASLETQISSLRDELANLYKTQGQNAQRLLSMNETLREKEEVSRVEAENLRKAREEIVALRRKVDQHNELMSEKDRTIQILHDEISTTLLELSQVEERNQTLSKDNAKLLQRWLDAKQAEAQRMNEANAFYEDMRTKHQAVLNWREGASVDAQDTAESGKGLGQTGESTAITKNGLVSPTSKTTDLTPNG